MNKIIKFARMTVLAGMSLAVFAAGSLVYSELKVYPRLITPGTMSSNENVFFDFDDLGDQKPELKIYDLSGRMVKTIQVLNPAAVDSGWRLVWDGRDDAGNIVLPGVYIYQWREGRSASTGTLVVAR